MLWEVPWYPQTPYTLLSINTSIVNVSVQVYDIDILLLLVQQYGHRITGKSKKIMLSRHSQARPTTASGVTGYRTGRCPCCVRD